MNGNGLEIEHKYLISYPDREELLKMEGASSARICQTYLETDDGSTERVRRWEQDGEVRYYRTIKRRISDLTHTEDENMITGQEYERLLSRRKEGTEPVVKERIMLPYAGHVVEVDIYPFWKDRAVAEVEVSCESEEVLLPNILKVIREVTGEGRYKNASLAYRHDFPV